MKTILHIEDDHSIAEAVELILSLKNYRTLHHDFFETFEEFVHLVETARPDLIIVDVKLPFIDGRDLCSFAKQDKRLKHIPLLVCSSIKLSNSEMKACMADAYIGKPFDIGKMQVAVESLLSKENIAA